MQKIYSQTCQCFKKLWDIKQKSVIHTQKKEGKWQEKLWDFLGKDSGATIIDMFKELKETMFHQLQNISKRDRNYV